MFMWPVKSTCTLSFPHMKGGITEVAYKKYFHAYVIFQTLPSASVSKMQLRGTYADNQ